MVRAAWLVLVVAGLMLAGAPQAAPPSDSTIEARLRALEQRVSDLEQREADRERRAASAPAPAPVAAPVAAAPPAAAPSPVVAERWRDAANWASLRRGMTWSQVKSILGIPGKVKAGVFGDVMYFPDTNGGSVEFDRDGRVSKWSRTAEE